MKRVMDICVSLLAIILLSPLMVAIALLVRIKMGCPVFFKQVRPGMKGKPFTLIKFRTMIMKYDDQNHLLSDGLRLTRLGTFLRSTSLDETPELFNVLKGEMSIVGPRPLLVQYLDRYTPEQMRRHEVKPGITGWAQINGRNAISWEEKFVLDVWYVDHVSMWLDIKIIAFTVWKVLKREGINQAGHATAEEFHGSSAPL